MNTRFKDQWLATSALALAIGCVGIPTGAVAQASFSKEANLKTASVKAEQVNVNTADAKQLQQVKGIGPSMAQKIVTARKKGGEFKSAADLSRRVKGLGEKRLVKLKTNGLLIPTAVLPKPPAPTGPDAGVPKMRK
ncbi:MAG: ComEA family DNA-binding protein [Burkholderiaceae bacterium]